MTPSTTADIGSPTAHAPASAGTLRALLRDTALLVATLATGGRIDDAAGFRNRCQQLIEHVSDALSRGAYPDDVRREALVALCGMLDEAALRHLPHEQRAHWQSKPLQVEHLNLHDAGERVIERITARMLETPPRLDLLEYYSAILGMGFTGRFARGEDGERRALLESLNTRLEQCRPESAPVFVIDRRERGLADRLHRLTPWAIAGLACVAAGVAWACWATMLDAQVAHLLAGSGKP